MTDLEAGLDRLYGADLEAFVAERAELVRALKRDGRTAEAAQVQELRKPSLAVWTVNRLVRVERKEVARLLAAGESLETAQTSLVRGGDRAAFAAARDRERKALGRLRQAAAAVLGARASEGTLDRVGSTLRAAAATAAGRQELARGRLTAEIEPAGFGALAGLELATAPTRAPAGKRTQSDAAERKARREAIAAARAKVETARDRESAAAKRLRETTASMRTAERAAERARVEHEAAVAAVEQARAELEAANAG